MDLRQELNAEIKKARGWLIAVGIIMFAMDMIFTFGVYADRLPQDWKTRIAILSSVILLVFLALAYFTAKKPRLCLILGLVVFWGIQLYNAVQDPRSLTQGLIIKIFFTLALVKGLQSASRAENLIKDLEEVFE
jgi:predicted MFS family arabinose efflux permease